MNAIVFPLLVSIALSICCNSLPSTEDTDRLNQFRERARARAEEFSVDTIMPQYEAIYNQVLQPTRV